MLNSIDADKEIKQHFWDYMQDKLANGYPSDVPPIVAPIFTPLGSAGVYIPEIQWHNVERKNPTDYSRHWLRFSLQDALTRQSSMAGGRSGQVGTRYTSVGIVFVQLFFSRISYETKDDVLGLIAQRAFQGTTTSNNVWFKNSTIVKLDPEENYFRSNVTAEYQYDSVIK